MGPPSSSSRTRRRRAAPRLWCSGTFHQKRDLIRVGRPRSSGSRVGMAQPSPPWGHPPPPRGLVVVGPLLSVSSPLDTQSSRSLPRATTNRGRATRDVPLAFSRRPTASIAHGLTTRSLRPATAERIPVAIDVRDREARWPPGLAVPRRGTRCRNGPRDCGASRLGPARAGARPAPTSESRILASAMRIRDVLHRGTDRPARPRPIGGSRRPTRSPVGRAGLVDARPSEPRFSASAMRPRVLAVAAGNDRHDDARSADPIVRRVRP